MATVQELVPLLKTAVADVLADNPSSPDDVMYALKQVSREWTMPEASPVDGGFQPSETPPEEG